MRAFLFPISLTLLLFISACSASSNQSQEVVNELTKQITMTPTMGGVTGILKSTSSGEPLDNTVVRLAKVYWNEDNTDGAFVLEGATSPSTISNEEGGFIIANIEPADYVMVVGEVIGIHEIISNPDGSAIIYTIQSGTILDIKTLEVDLP